MPQSETGGYSKWGTLAWLSGWALWVLQGLHHNFCTSAKVWCIRLLDRVVCRLIVWFLA